MKNKNKKNYKEKQKIKMKEKLTNLQTQIDLHSYHLFDPNHNQSDNIKSDSWIDYNVFDNQNLFDSDVTKHLVSDEIEHDGWFTHRIQIYPTKNQKIILLDWMYKYILVYNMISYYLRKGYYNYTHFHKRKYPETNITKVKALFKIKKDIIARTKPVTIKTVKKIRNKTKIITKQINCDLHVLDAAIQDALNRYNQCMSNIKNGHIKHFSLRDIKLTKPKKIIKIEHSRMNENGFIPRALGKMKCKIKNFNYAENAKTMTIIQYDSKKNNFFMFMKYKKKDKSNKLQYVNKTETVSIDPGIRTMLTCYSNNEITEIGTNCMKKIKKQLKRIDRISENASICEKQKKKIVKKKNDKIKRMVNDVHWKIAKMLTDKYRTVIIGNFSTKSMGKQKMSKMIKRIGSKYGFYKFKEILKYKCKYKNTKYIEIDEAYTSKSCSNCGNYKKNMKAEKIYKCKKCGTIIDRDINGAKNILMLSL